MSSRLWGGHRLVFAAALVCYLGLAFTLATVKTPWVDEGWIASAPANWSRTGSIGTPSLVPTGSWLNAELTGINEYTYWNMPVALVLQGVWYRLFGFTLLTMRSLGILFGLVALISWSLIVTRLSGSRVAGSLTAALLAVDFTFLWSAADGRLDMMCAGFGSAAIAAYLLLRERRWTLALWLATLFSALAIFTHPNGILPLLSILFLMLYYDRARLRWRDSAAVLPYLALAAAWGIYILRRPDYFLAQFAANAGAIEGTRWSGVANPLRALKLEILVRYFMHFDGSGDSLWGGRLPSATIMVPFLYWAALACAWLYRPVRRCRGAFALLCLALLHFGFMTILVGMKAPYYLATILPLYAGALAVWLWMSHARRSQSAPASLAVALALVVCQAGAIVHKIRANAYRSEYAPAVQFARQRLQQSGGHVVANSFFGIDLGFERVKDDARLGYYNRTPADLVVADPWYERWWNGVFPQTEPQVARYVRHLLQSEYVVVFDNGSFRVYARRQI